MVSILSWEFVKTVTFGLAVGFAVMGVLLFTYWKLVEVFAWIASRNATPPKVGGRRGSTHAGGRIT